jgi:hypothetical protein
VVRRLPAAVVCHRYLIVVPRSLPTAPYLERRTYVILVPRPVPRLLPGHRYLIVVPRPLPAAQFLVRRRYLNVVPRPLPAAPLDMRRTYLIAVLRPVSRPFPAATRRCRLRRKYSADGQRSKVNITSFMCTEAR